MNQLALWSWKVPLWVWPVVVCLTAWLFRRIMLGAGNVGFRVPWLDLSSLLPPAVGRSGKVSTQSTSLHREERSSFVPSLARWWDRFGNRTAAPQLVTVRARKSLGPQQQVFILRVENREYHVLSQLGVVPLVLSAHALHSFEPLMAELETSGSKPECRNPGSSRLRRMTADAARRSRRDPLLLQSLSYGRRSSFDGASK